MINIYSFQGSIEPYLFDSFFHTSFDTIPKVMSFRGRKMPLRQQQTRVSPSHRKRRSGHFRLPPEQGARPVMYVDDAARRPAAPTTPLCPMLSYHRAEGCVKRKHAKDFASQEKISGLAALWFSQSDARPFSACALAATAASVPAGSSCQRRSSSCRIFSVYAPSDRVR